MTRLLADAAEICSGAAGNYDDSVAINDKLIAEVDEAQEQEEADAVRISQSNVDQEVA